MYRKYSQKGA